MGCVEFLVAGQVLSRHPTSLLPGEGFLGWRKAPCRSSGLAGPRERPSGPPSRAGQPIKLDPTLLAPAHVQMSLDSCRESLTLLLSRCLQGAPEDLLGLRCFPASWETRLHARGQGCPFGPPRGCHSGDLRGAAW